MTNLITTIRAKGMTVASVARLAGVTRPTIYALTNPERSPELKTLLAVARVLNMKPHEIRPELRQ